MGNGCEGREPQDVSSGASCGDVETDTVVFSALPSFLPASLWLVAGEEKVEDTVLFTSSLTWMVKDTHGEVPHSSRGCPVPFLSRQPHLLTLPHLSLCFHGNFLSHS